MSLTWDSASGMNPVCISMNVGISTGMPLLDMISYEPVGSSYKICMDISLEPDKELIRVLVTWS